MAVALAVNAETVTDYVYDEPETLQPIKKGKKAGTIKIGNQEIKVEESAAEKDAEQSDTKTYKIYGIVKDKESGDPVVGAIVRIANTNIGAVTDLSGEFAINVQKGDALVADYVGYASDVVVIKDPTAKYVIKLQKDNSDRTYDVVDEMPQFPGGVGKLMEYMAMNVRYPKEAEDKCLQGRVITTFVVEKDGSITDVEVLKSIDPALDAEAVRVIKAMPKWTPGKQNGDPIRVKYTVPVTFRLQGGDAIPGEKVKGANVMNETVVVGIGDNAKAIHTNAPYVLVDGKPIDSDKLKDVDPKTIERIEVLKDKPAVEKYGEKAKNGVIVITTKK